MPNEKKRKRESTTSNGDSHGSADNLDTSKPTAVYTPHGGRPWTVSLALPGSIISNAKNLSLKTYLAGTIARALAVFCVDEIIIFSDDSASETPPDPNAFTAFTHPSHFLAQMLSYLETPPHLRTQLFAMHDNLRKAGELSSLDMPHHLRRDEHSPFREGITRGTDEAGTWVDVGLSSQVVLADVSIPDFTRVTVQLSDTDEGAVAVDPALPRTQNGYYWGYAVRSCASLSAVLTECPFDGGYDLSIGTSERGTSINETFSDDAQAAMPPSQRDFNHLLLVLGGVAGLETAAANDKELKKMGIGKANVADLFDYWVNLCPGQGSRTIRTEEAVWLGLMGVKRLVERR